MHDCDKTGLPSTQLIGEYEIIDIDFTGIATITDVLIVVNDKLTTSHIAIDANPETIPVYCSSDKDTICIDEEGIEQTTTIYHNALQLKTNSQGNHSRISLLSPASVGTYIGDLLLLNKEVIDGYTTGDSKSAKNMNKFLQMLGYTEENIVQLCKDSHSEGIKDIQLKWKQSYGFGQDDFEYILGLIKSKLSMVAKVEIFNSCVTYDKAIFTAPYEPKSIHEEYIGLQEFSSIPNYKEGQICDEEGYCHMGNIRVYGEEMKPDEPLGITYKWSGDLNINGQSIICYNSVGDDVTSTIEESLLIVLKSILYINGNEFYTFDDKVVHSEQHYSIDNPLGGTYEYVTITTKETFLSPFNSEFEDTIEKYTTKDHFIDLPQEYDSMGLSTDAPTNRPYKSSYLNYFWMYRELDDTYQSGERIPGLFHKSNAWLNEESQLYMTVKGLDKITPVKLQLAIQKYADVSAIRKSKSCGGFFGCFFKGIMSIIIGILTIISRLLYAIPILKQVVQVIIWVLSGGNWVTTEQEFVASTNILLATIIAIVITVSSWGKAGPAMKVFIAMMVTYSLYSAHTNLKSLRASIEYQDNLAKLTEKERLLVEDHLDKAEDAIELEEGRVDEKDHFGGNSTFTIKYK